MPRKKGGATRLYSLLAGSWTQYNVRGRRWIDCNGCMVRQPSGREIASQFAVLFAAIKELITPAEPTKKRSSRPGSERTTNSTNSLAKKLRSPGSGIFQPPSDFSVSAYQRLITRAPARASYPSCVTVYVAHPCSLRSVFQVLLPVPRSDSPWRAPCSVFASGRTCRAELIAQSWPFLNS
jgi:hypothetical protein